MLLTIAVTVTVTFARTTLLLLSVVETIIYYPRQVEYYLSLQFLTAVFFECQRHSISSGEWRPSNGLRPLIYSLHSPGPTHCECADLRVCLHVIRRACVSVRLCQSVCHTVCIAAVSKLARHVVGRD